MSKQSGRLFQTSVAFSENLNFTILDNKSSNIFPFTVPALTEVQVKGDKPNNKVLDKWKIFQKFPSQNVIYEYFIN